LPITSIDAKDVQGLVRFGYGRLTEACYLLLRIRDAAAARDWCAVAPVATAESQANPPDTALQVAFTWDGLCEVGLPPEVLAGFSAEFQSGMAGQENRSRRLGDVDHSAPVKWWWGGPISTPHVLVMLFAMPGKLDEWRRTVQAGAWDAAFELIRCLDTTDMGGYEPFGFKDGISQPQIDWEGTPGILSQPASDQIAYTNQVATGELLLGYVNEYGKYTDRPLVDSTDRRAADLPDAEDVPGKKDVGRNGTYVVMRTLEQDVRGFWKFVEGQTDSGSMDSQGARQQLAESMVGRTMEGQPLAQLSPVPIPGISSDPKDDLNRFTFDQDPAGTGCPIGAHIRRANPRNTDYPNRPSWWLALVLSKLGWASRASLGFQPDIMASTRFHRILRRGREYGPRLTPEQAVQSPPADVPSPLADVPSPPADVPKPGLHFLCLNANIVRQFEFVQNAWLMSTKFDGLRGESDPLLGNRTPIGDGRSTDNFAIPREGGARRCITGLPQFITVRGGAYFFMPGIRALRYFSRAGEVPQAEPRLVARP
jgi:deferrochelatase/peroxidase EfeB